MDKHRIDRKYYAGFGVGLLIIIGISLMVIGKWGESNRPRNTPEINRGHPIEEDYFPLYRDMFSTVSDCVQLELYLDGYPDTENENVNHVGFIRIPDGSPLQLSYTCLDETYSIELYNKELDYYFDKTSTKERFDGWVAEYRREYDNANLGSSIEFSNWLQLRFIMNSLQLYRLYLRDIYLQGLPCSEIDFGTAISRMGLVWGLELAPSVPGHLKIDYELDHRELKYTIDYEGFIMEDSSYMDVPSRYIESNGIIRGTLFENSEEE